MNSLYKTVGIYGIKNKINNHIYIGKTEMNFGDRRDSHYSLLENNKHWNKYLQNAWNKYGKDNFEFIIIHKLVDDEDINELERYYIKYYRDLNLSYNIADGGQGGGNLGKHLSEETKRKISEEHKQAWNNLTDEQKKKKLKNFAGCNKGKKMDRNSEQYKKIVEREHTKSNAAKYSIDTVRKIRELHEKKNIGYTEISNLLNVPRHTVYMIATYRRWKYVS